ncbi:hypothetical protein BUE80_DR001022 [Diplocarpon rosae]|nr:hypothetical protein BUE80_DR001022 [Diplocarpon rosae]
MYFPRLLLLTQASAVFANTEKIIFYGPNNLRFPAEHSALQEMQLESLSPEYWSLRTHITTEFPTSSSQYGQTSWFLLHSLQEGQKYEVRQPTSFRLETYELYVVFQTPELISSLAQYSETRQPKVGEVPTPSIWPVKKGMHEDTSSMLLLRLFAAADYYTTNKTLMEHVPSVYADLILDPFVFNIFPRSLLPTAAYIIMVALGSWYIARILSGWINNLSAGHVEKKSS